MYGYEIDKLREYADNFFIIQESGKLADMDRNQLESLLRTAHFQLRVVLDHIVEKQPTLNKDAVKAYIMEAIEAYRD